MRVLKVNLGPIYIILRSLNLHKKVISSLIDKYLTIISRVRVGYELATIISYPTSASGIIILLKRPQNIDFPTLFVKTADFQLVFNFEQTRTVTIFGEHGIMAHIP